MKRLHLIEWEDYPWFPAVIRDGGTACLRAFGKLGGMGRFMAPALADALRATGHRRLIDLCSGGAGPLPELLDGLADAGLEVTALMTDKFPNADALGRAAGESGGRIDFIPTSVDATDVPADLTGFRTIINGFHHFSPDLARGILADAVRKREPIAVIEIVEATPIAIANIIISPFVAMVLMLGIKPRRPAWWLFTYLVPLIPAMLLWDGLASCFRVYSPEELLELVEEIDGHETFEWTSRRVRMSPIPMRCSIFIGRPKA